MALCITTGDAVTQLAVAAFTLVWTHSVERVEWQEDWRVEGGRLVLVEARVKGSGAGMDPGEDAVLRDGWWRWRPRREVAELRLARSDAVAGWRLCTERACRSVGHGDGAEAAALLRPCRAGPATPEATP